MSSGCQCEAQERNNTLSKEIRTAASSTDRSNSQAARPECNNQRSPALIIASGKSTPESPASVKKAEKEDKDTQSLVRGNARQCTCQRDLRKTPATARHDAFSGR